MIAKYLVFIFVVHISATDANVSTNICKDYLDPDLRSKMLVKMSKDKKIAIDINNDGTEEKVLLKLSGHDIASTVLNIYDQNNKSISHKIEFYENVRFDRRMQILFYKGYYYIVHYSDVSEKLPTYITHINSKNIEYPLCKYKYKRSLKLTYHDKDYTPNKCDSMLKKIQEEKIIPFDTLSKLKLKKDRYAFDNGKIVLPLKKGYKNIGVAYLDYNNDGKKEYLQFFNHVYGKNRFFTILNSDLATFKDKIPIWSSGWLENNNKIYSFFKHNDNGSIDIKIRESSNNAKTICIYEYGLDELLLEKSINNK